MYVSANEKAVSLNLHRYDEERDVPCMHCGRADGEESFVLCDGCSNGGHFQCLGMAGVPEGDWRCVVCAGAREEKERKEKEKAEEHLYTVIKLATAEDLVEQIGSEVLFDLVDHDKCRSFRVVGLCTLNQVEP